VDLESLRGRQRFLATCWEQLIRQHSFTSQ